MRQHITIYLAFLEWGANEKTNVIFSLILLIQLTAYKNEKLQIFELCNHLFATRVLIGKRVIRKTLHFLSQNNGKQFSRQTVHDITHRLPFWIEFDNQPTQPAARFRRVKKAANAAFTVGKCYLTCPACNSINTCKEKSHLVDLPPFVGTRCVLCWAR